MSDAPPPPPPPPSGAPAPPPPPPSTQVTGPIGIPRSAGLVILLSIVTFGIWPIVWSYQNGDELKRHNGDGLGGVIYLALMLSALLVPFVGVIVTMFLMAGEVERMYRNAGKQPPITTLWGLWFLLPLIGNIIWYVRIQNALNDHWRSLGAMDKPRL